MYSVMEIRLMLGVTFFKYSNYLKYYRMLQKILSNEVFNKILIKHLIISII